MQTCGRAVENVEDILAELKEKQEEERRQEIRDAIKVDGKQ